MTEMEFIELQEIEKTLSETKDKLRTMAKILEFADPIEFALKEEMSGTFDTIPKKKGLYLFEILTSNIENKADYMKWFEATWGSSDYRSENTPNAKKKRVRFHKIIPMWLPLYLGKAQDLRGRVNQHVFLDIKKPTTALKLLSRKNMHGQTFRVSTIQLDIKNWQMISPIFESVLRERINPILGRQ